MRNFEFHAIGPIIPDRARFVLVWALNHRLVPNENGQRAAPAPLESASAKRRRRYACSSSGPGVSCEAQLTLANGSKRQCRVLTPGSKFAVARYGDGSPDRLDDAEGPSPAEKAVGAGKQAAAGKRKYEARTSALECVHQHHERDGGGAEGGKHVPGSVSLAPPARI